MIGQNEIRKTNLQNIRTVHTKTKEIYHSSRCNQPATKIAKTHSNVDQFLRAFFKMIGQDEFRKKNLQNIRTVQWKTSVLHDTYWMKKWTKKQTPEKNRAPPLRERRRRRPNCEVLSPPQRGPGSALCNLAGSAGFLSKIPIGDCKGRESGLKRWAMFTTDANTDTPGFAPEHTEGNAHRDTHTETHTQGHRHKDTVTMAQLQRHTGRSNGTKAHRHRHIHKQQIQQCNTTETSKDALPRDTSTHILSFCSWKSNRTKSDFGRWSCDYLRSTHILIAHLKNMDLHSAPLCNRPTNRPTGWLYYINRP